MHSNMKKSKNLLSIENYFVNTVYMIGTPFHTIFGVKDESEFLRFPHCAMQNCDIEPLFYVNSLWDKSYRLFRALCTTLLTNH